MNSIIEFKPSPNTAIMRWLTTYSATFLTATLVCGGMAQAQSVSLGGVQADVSVGSGGVSADVGVGGGSGVSADSTVSGSGSVKADVSVGGTSTSPTAGSGTGSGTATGTGSGGKTVSGVQGNVAVGPIVKLPVARKTNNAPAKPVAILGPKSVLGVDTNVAGLDVVADALKYNGNLLDVCIGSCRDTTGNGGGGNGGGGGGDGSGGGDGTSGGDGSNGNGDGGQLTGVTGTTGTTTTAPTDGTVAVAGLGTGGPCGDANAAASVTKASMTNLPENGNPGPSFALSTADLNLPIPGVELRCSAGGNAQVFNGFTVVDMHGKAIGIVHDAFLTDHLKIRRIQFQGLDQRCFGLGNGNYKVKGNSVSVNVPASFIYQ